MFERLAVTLERIDFLDPALADQDDARERGARLELRLVDTAPVGSIYASPQRLLRPAVCRIDLLESQANAADRMHWHPAMLAGEPGDRVFDPAMADDPLRWLGEHLGQVEVLLARSGVSIDERMLADIGAIAETGPEVVAAAGRALAWARVEPWPDVIRDERGLATSQR